MTPPKKEALRKEICSQTCASASWVNNVLWYDIDIPCGYPSLCTINTAVLKVFHSLKMQSCLEWYMGAL